MSEAPEPTMAPTSSTHPGLPSRAPSTSVKPKGILKNAPTPAPTLPASPAPGTPGQHLQWDEENLALTELQKDSQMKITEPKTPYVRYNAELDEIEGDIPAFSLTSDHPLTASPVASPTEPSFDNTSPPQSGPSSRRPSVSSNARSSSRSSSRSTSFTLPSDAKGDFIVVGAREGGEVEEDEEMDPETAAKHAAFVRARGRHYSNEAEAMKRAQALLDEEDDDEEDTGDAMDEDDQPNGRGRGGVPPVPPIPSHPKVNGVMKG
ncbi:hypothetical protein OF83DRAFT_1140162 [Amylostereum chailletii]|nr:hypothetical protein OF83DRAFT_1140162 [Amylostereum chailletii]